MPELKPEQPPVRSGDIDPQFLLLCHRIALDFGPAAARIALERHERESGRRDADGRDAATEGTGRH